MARQVVPYALNSEDAIGAGHPTRSDVVNRALRFILSKCGVDPDAVFNGFRPVFNVAAAGAVGDGVADDTSAIQECITAAGVKGGAVVIPGGFVCAVQALLVPEGVVIVSEGGTKAGRGTLKYIGAAGGKVLSPVNINQGNEKIHIKCLEIDGNALANIGVDFYHVTHGRVRDCYIHGCTNGALACGVRLYRDRDAGLACYYNQIEGGKIAFNTIGILVTGTGAGSQDNCANANLIKHVDLVLNTTRNVYFERGNSLICIGVLSEQAGTVHFETSGRGLQVIGCRIENDGGTPALPGILLNTTATSTVESGNSWYTFTNDPVVDNSTTKDILRFSPFGSGVAGGIAGGVQFVRGALTELFSKPGSNLIDINGGAVGSTGKVRINRTTASADGSTVEFYNGTGTRLALVDSVGRFRASALAPAVQVLVDGATVTFDCSLGGYGKLSAGGSRTMAAPTNTVTQYITFDILNNTGGAIVTTWNATFKLAGAWVDPATTKRRTIMFMWDGANWVEQRRSPADI